MSKNNKVAKKFGKVLAHIQSTVDDVVGFGFKKMKEAGAKQGKINKNPKTVGEKGKVALKKTARFLGQAGESFYEEYEKIKAKKAEEEKEK